MLRSLDVQQILLQSNKTERIQQTNANGHECQQRHFESEMAKERRALREKTKALEASARLKVREEKKHDQRGKNRGPKGAGGAGGDPEEDKALTADLSIDEPGSKVDIRI